jgi:hypothetical protein
MLDLFREELRANALSVRGGLIRASATGIGDDAREDPQDAQVVDPRGQPAVDPRPPDELRDDGVVRHRPRAWSVHCGTPSRSGRSPAPRGPT